jgi:hypothetical protein
MVYHHSHGYGKNKSNGVPTMKNIWQRWLSVGIILMVVVWCMCVGHLGVYGYPTQFDGQYSVGLQTRDYDVRHVTSANPFDNAYE